MVRNEKLSSSAPVSVCLFRRIGLGRTGKALQKTNGALQRHCKLKELDASAIT